VELKHLEPERQALLTAVVAEHMKQHGNDPQQSLAFLDSTDALGSARGQLELVSDLDLRRTLPMVYRDHGERGGGDDANSALDISASPRARFRVLRPHAQGAMGIVTVALDEELDREVALKELNSDHADDPESRSRFRLEAHLTGGLEHPGIVPVYGLGHDDEGRLFYAMRLIHGDTLQDFIDRLHKAKKSGVGSRRDCFDLRKLLSRFVEVCHTIHYAHSRGVIHRDLKPGNIILGGYGETLVLDWGLAKPLGAAADPGDTASQSAPPSSTEGSVETQLGQIVGTPAYMSPEQAAGRHEDVGPASDVYGLGATLYCLLTGQPPIRGRSLEATLQMVQQGDFPRPRQVNRWVDRGLEAICLKAMATKAGERYSSTAALAEDVELWLADEPVSACRESLSEHVSRWTRKHGTSVPGLLGAVLVITVSLSVFTGTMLLQAYHAPREHQAELAAQQAALALEFDLALQEYVDEGLRPEIRKGGGQDASVAQALCSPYAAREVSRKVRQRFPQYLIKFSSDNPRNAASQAGPEEMRLLQYFRDHPDVPRWVGKLDLDGKAYFVNLSVRRTEASCLQCHGVPQDSPQPLRDREGKPVGFYRTVGDVAGMDVVAVPLEQTGGSFLADATATLGITVIMLILLFATILFAFRLLDARSAISR
jgi:serine/threonine protein kinase